MYKCTTQREEDHHTMAGNDMEYTFNFQMKGGDPCKLTVEAESYEAAFQKICGIRGSWEVWRDKGYIDFIPWPEEYIDYWKEPEE